MPRLILKNVGSLCCLLALLSGAGLVARQIGHTRENAFTSNASRLSSAPTVTEDSSRFYSASSFWNTPIGPNPLIDPNSELIVAASVAKYAQSANLSNGDEWSVPFVFVTPAAKSYQIRCTRYCSGAPIQFRIPAAAHPATGSDHHLAVIDGDKELDMWLASYDAAKDSWSAGFAVVNSISGNGSSCAVGQHCNGAVAAGFALLGGLIRPGEIRSGHIDHALALTTPYTRASFTACPATHNDGVAAAPDAIPEGARIQLSPSFNVEAQPWPAWKKVIVNALQIYGAYVVDTGGSLSVRAADSNGAANSWASVDVPDNPSLSDIPWHLMRILELRRCD